MEIDWTDGCIKLYGRYTCKGHLPLDGIPEDGLLSSVSDTELTILEIEHAIRCVFAGWVRSLLPVRH